MERRPATPDEQRAAQGIADQMAEHEGQVVVDDDALVSEIEGSESIWVQAWIYVPKEAVRGN